MSARKLQQDLKVAGRPALWANGGVRRCIVQSVNNEDSGYLVPNLKAKFKISVNYTTLLGLSLENVLKTSLAY